MPRMNAANTKGAYGIGMCMPMIDKISNATTMVIAERRKINLLSLIGNFIIENILDD